MICKLHTIYIERERKISLIVLSVDCKTSKLIIIINIRRMHRGSDSCVLGGVGRRKFDYFIRLTKREEQWREKQNERTRYNTAVDIILTVGMENQRNG